jgi:hypothetical protein
MERSSREGSVLFVVESSFAPFSHDPVASHAEMEPSLSPSKPVHTWQKRHASRLLSHLVQISADQKLTPHEQHREADGSSANGREVPPGSHARSACCCIRSSLVQLRFPGGIGAEECIGAPARSFSVINASK